MASKAACTLLRSAGVNSLAPFLYQTRTLTAPTLSSIRKPSNCRLQHTTPDGTLPATEHSQLQDVFQEQSAPSRTADDRPQPRRSYLRRRAASFSRQKSKVEKEQRQLKAMTRVEKKVFAQLLHGIGVNADEDKPTQQALNAKEQKEISELTAIFDSVLKEAQQRKTAPDPEPDYPPGESEPSITLQGLELETSEDQSPPLRYSDLGFEPSTGGGEDPEVTVAEAIDLVVKRETSKIEFALFAAIEAGQGDMGLWQVCKERIFTMLGHLGEESPAETADLHTNLPSTTEAATDNGANPSTSTSSSSEVVKIPKGIPAAPVVAALYPKTLLIAFRLLKTHFPDSPLISQFRHTIKAHGRASNILGSSADLCDELIFFYWRGCNDLPAVVSLLREMDLTGLTPSWKTRNLLNDIIHQRKRDLALRRQSKPTQDSWWHLPPNQMAFHELVGKNGGDGLLTRLSSRHGTRRNTPSTAPL